MDELCRGAFHVQALTEAAFRPAFVGPLGLRQHGALEAQAGQILQRHAGWKEKLTLHQNVTPNETMECCHFTATSQRLALELTLASSLCPPY